MIVRIDSTAIADARRSDRRWSVIISPATRFRSSSTATALSTRSGSRWPPVPLANRAERRSRRPVARAMAMESEEFENVPPQGHVRVVYLGPVAPHWRFTGCSATRRPSTSSGNGLRPGCSCSAARPAVPSQPRRSPRCRARAPHPRMGSRLRRGRRVARKRVVSRSIPAGRRRAGKVAGHHERDPAADLHGVVGYPFVVATDQRHLHRVCSAPSSGRSGARIARNRSFCRSSMASSMSGTLRPVRGRRRRTRRPRRGSVPAPAGPCARGCRTRGGSSADRAAAPPSRSSP